MRFQMENKTNTKVSDKIRKLTLAAMFAALTCVATIVIQVPSPMNGYVNLGDVLVLMCGFVLGPVYGTAAAGIGSMLADVFTGYLHYAPGTLVIKAAMALVAYLLFAAFRNKSVNVTVSTIISGLVAEVIMVLGYFGYACLLLGKGLAAASSIPGNIVQGVFAIVCSTIICTILSKVKIGSKSIVK